LGPAPQDESSIVMRANRLRKVPLDEFSIDDVRFMLVQQIGLPWLLIIATEYLEKDLFAEGNYYEGDLLNSVLSIKSTSWQEHKESWIKIDSLIKRRTEELRALRPKVALEAFYTVKFD
jgi:CDI immunity proteins